MTFRGFIKSKLNVCTRDLTCKILDSLCCDNSHCCTSRHSSKGLVACYRAQVCTRSNDRRNKLHAEEHATETLRNVCDEAKRDRGKVPRTSEQQKKDEWMKEGRKEMEIMSSHDANRDLPRRVIKRVLPAGNDCCLARANSTRERNEGLCGSRVCYWLA